MKPNALVLALMTAAAVLPGSARAADDICSRIFIYAVNQFCQLLPNGQTLCQPVGLAGPAPSCESPNPRQFAQIPLGPPVIQTSPFSPFASAGNPYAPNPYAPNPFAANPMAANAYPPFPFAPNLFASPNPSTPNPYAPATAYLPPTTPPTLPFLPLTPVAAAPVTPAAVLPAPAAPVEKPLAKLMPEAAPAKAPEPVKPVAPVASAVAAPAPVAIAPAPAVNPEAAAKAEITRVQAEKAIEDALAHFEFDSAELTATGRAMLDDWIKQTTGDTPILVTGHADRLGPEPYNAKLSQLRAEAVKKYLIGKGKPAKRIEIRAKGEHMPLISCAGDATPETKSCLAPNRRAEITVKPAPKTLAKPVVKKAAKR